LRHAGGASGQAFDEGSWLISPALVKFHPLTD
jgi:hypothetical protein